MKIKSLVVIFFIIILFVGGIYLKMKHDEKKEEETKYYDQQKERIILFLKYNIKGYKEVNFEEQKENPLDGFVIKGYINNDKSNTFSAHMWSKHDYQFEYISSYSDKLGEMMIENPKTVSQIKKEQEHKKDEN